jgi:hypothetical protein
MEWFTELSFQTQGIVLLVLLLVVFLFLRPVLLRLINHGVKLGKEDGLVIGGSYQETNREWRALQDAVHQTSRNVKDLTERIETMEATLLKMVICNKDLPTVERCAAYDKYKAMGYNSWVDQYYLDNLQPRLHESLTRERRDGP